MEKENIRVLLDFSDLQDREHNFVWMLISTIDLKNIADLKNAIINKLDLDTSGIKLFVNGGLLLEEEKIIILRENDTVQIRYEKLPHSFCHNSSLAETQARRLSLTVEKNDGNKVSKHSKKHKRRSEGIDLPVDRECKKVTQNESFLYQFPLDQESTLNQLKVNSSDMEVDFQTLADKCNGNKILKHSKKHKRRSEGIDLPVDRECKKVTRNESFLYQFPLDQESTLNQLKVNSSDMEVDVQTLADKCNGDKISKHSKKHKSKAEEQKIVLQYETLPDTSICSSSSVVQHVENSKLSFSAGNCVGNNALKNSKKHKKRNHEDNLFVEEENRDMNLSKKKRKGNGAPVDAFEENEIQLENSVLKSLFTEQNISSSKKNESSYVSEEDIVLNESDNEVDFNKVPDVTVTCEIPKDASNLKVKENNEPADISVDSLPLGSNCKKRKRKRNRKRRMDANLLGPFLSENIVTFQNVTEDGSKALSPCDDYVGIRKHIRFTSPDRELIAKEIQTVEAEISHSSSQSNSSPIKAILPPAPKFPTLLENIVRATEIANKSSLKFCDAPNSNCMSPSYKTKSLTTSQLDTANEFSKNTSIKTCKAPSSAKLFSPKPTINSTNESLAEQIVDHNSASISENPVENSAPSYTNYPHIEVLPPMGAHIAFKLLELGENYSPEVSDYKEGVIKTLNPHSEELEIELINIETRPGRTGKFENLKEDEEPPDEVIEKVTVPWSSLIEPRLIS